MRERHSYYRYRSWCERALRVFGSNAKLHEVEGHTAATEEGDDLLSHPVLVSLGCCRRMLIGLKIHMESGSADSKIGVTIADSQAFGNGPRDVEKLMIEVIGLASAMYRGLRAQMFPSQTHLMLFLKGLRDLMIFMTQKCCWVHSTLVN